MLATALTRGLLGGSLVLGASQGVPDHSVLVAVIAAITVIPGTVATAYFGFRRDGKQSPAEDYLEQRDRAVRAEAEVLRLRAVLETGKTRDQP